MRARVVLSCLPSQPAGRAICRAAWTKNVGRDARQAWIRSALPFVLVCQKSRVSKRSSLRAEATPRVVYECERVRCESRAGQQHQAHDAAADGATLRTSRAAGETLEAVKASQAKDHSAAWRPLGGGGGARGVGGSWSDGGSTDTDDTTGSSCSTRNAGRGPCYTTGK